MWLSIISVYYNFHRKLHLISEQEGKYFFFRVPYHFLSTLDLKTFLTPNNIFHFLDFFFFLEWDCFNVYITDLDFTFLEMNPFTLVNGEPYPLDMRGELDDTAAFKNFKK